MSERIKLKVLGLSYSPLQNGAYGLLLAVEGDSPIRIPVVVGAPEAQSIAMRIEKVLPPRPLTHDLFCTFAQAFGVRMEEVFIHKFEDGIYYSEITFTDGDRTVVLDSRTSDAIAIAIRCGAPIYTTPEVVEECGIELKEVKAEDEGIPQDSEDSEDGPGEGFIDFEDSESVGEEGEDDLSESEMSPAAEELLDDETLERRMRRYAENDDYESAMRLKAILDRRHAADRDTGGSD